MNSSVAPSIAPSPFASATPAEHAARHSTPVWSRDVADTFWTSVRYFNLYRLILAAFLLAIGLANPVALGLAEITPRPFAIGGGAYLLATLLLHAVLIRWRRYFAVQLALHVMVDIAGLTVMMYATGGYHSGLGVLLLISLAGAALVADRRLVLMLASIATLAMLGQQLLWVGTAAGAAHIMLGPALLCVAFFVTALLTNRLADRVIANEELARQRGIELESQIRINALVIRDLQEGVLVVDERGVVRQLNPRAVQLCGPSARVGAPIAVASPELAAQHELWRHRQERDADDALVDVDLAVRVRVRFHAAGLDDRQYALVFLDDLGRLESEAQTLKLAALGRLTGSIAHEIRNPLSAITHATDLLGEENRAQGRERLTRIIRDNAWRLERMVSDVLELNRRDRAVPESVALKPFLALFVEEFVHQSGVTPGLIGPVASDDPDGVAAITFDRVHLHQILWNLVRNAVRHASGQPGAVVIGIRADGERVEIVVTDDGPGIAPDVRAHLFEPFFTTDSRGTGLGLYISRELAVANGARLDAFPRSRGAEFRLTIRRRMQ